MSASHFCDVASPPTEPFSGEMDKVKGFLLKLAFSHSPQTFPTGTQKVSYIIGILRGKPLGGQKHFLTSLQLKKLL